MAGQRRGYRAGAFAATNTALAATGVVAFAGLTVVAGEAVAEGHGRAWSIVGLLVAAVAVVLLAVWGCSSASGLRTVRVTSGPEGPALSLPGFSVRHGFRRESIALTDVEQVRLDYRSQPRNGRWQLVVVRADGTRVACDSVTSSRSGTADITATKAHRVVNAIGDRVRSARTA